MICWTVDNLKCGGCETRVTSALSAIEGVTQVAVDAAQGQVCFEANEDRFATIESTLLRLGYPRTGQVTGLAAVKADVMSVVSCAIGRVQSK